MNEEYLDEYTGKAYRPATWSHTRFVEFVNNVFRYASPQHQLVLAKNEYSDILNLLEPGVLHLSVEFMLL